MIEIQDIDYTFEIKDNKQTIEVDTELINAFLESFILKTNKKIHIKIVLAEVEDIVIFEDMEFYGSHLIPVRVTPISHNAEMFNYSAQKIALNNKLRIYIQGMKDTDIDLTIRISKDGRTDQ